MQKWLTVSLLLVIGIAGAWWMTPVQAQGQGGPPEPSEIATLEYRCQSYASGTFYSNLYVRGSSLGVTGQTLAYGSGNDGSGGAAACRDVHVPAVEASVQANGCPSSQQVYADDANRTDLLLRVTCAGSRDQVIRALFETAVYVNNAAF